MAKYSQDNGVDLLSINAFNNMLCFKIEITPAFEVHGVWRKFLCVLFVPSIVCHEFLSAPHFNPVHPTGTDIFVSLLGVT